MPVDVTLSIATLDGTWRDGAGHSGPFRLTPGAGTGGSPRPEVAPGSIPGAFGLLPDGGFVARGTLESGDLPAAGLGTRMMWYPRKAAFRAGHLTIPAWDDVNIGLYGTAFGLNTVAGGLKSTALGEESLASGERSVAFDNNTVASGFNSLAGGEFTTASGGNSTALGRITTASGANAVAIGVGTLASGAYARVPGREWSYKAQDAAIRHIGPTAQDFRAAFGVGDFPLRINTIDADGVALAGVKALDTRTRDMREAYVALQEATRALRDENAALRGAVDALRREVDALKARGEPLAGPGLVPARRLAGVASRCRRDAEELTRRLPRSGR